ncbi:MAG: thymidine kinase [Chitinophagales bacterium]|nr:thymidine kinase [Chitinophagales bacterium]
MFIEPQLKGERRGWIEVITGSMFSGKTEELIRRLKRVKIANLKTEIFKPGLDVRYDEKNIVSHDANLIQSTPVSHSSNILLLSADVEVVGIDEAQFFDEGIIDVCNKLAMRGTRVIVAGLDMDYKGNPFGPMPQLLAIADYITKVHAICVQCGSIATHSYRKVKGDAQVLLGEKNEYEPRCRSCFVKEG